MPSLRGRPSSSQATEKLLPTTPVSPGEPSRQAPARRPAPGLTTTSGPQTTTTPVAAAAEPGRFRSLFQRSKSLRNPSRGLHKTAGVPSAGLGPEKAVAITEHQRQDVVVTESPTRTESASFTTRQHAAPLLRSHPSSTHSEPPTPRPPPDQLEHPAEAMGKMPPLLKKRPSFRDRFRRKPSPPTQVAPEEPRVHSVYVPRHAASDFSRLSVPPRRHEIFPIAESPVVAPPPRDDHELARVEVPRRLQLEDEKPRYSHAQQDSLGVSRLREDTDRGGQGHGPTTQSRPQHGPAAQMKPVPTHHRSSSTASDDTPDRREPAQTAGHDRQDDNARQEQTLGAEAAPEAEPSSDYQEFLSRAAAEDRAHREQVWRALTSASRAAPRSRLESVADTALAAAEGSGGGGPFDTVGSSRSASPGNDAPNYLLAAAPRRSWGRQQQHGPAAAATSGRDGGDLPALAEHGGHHWQVVAGVQPTGRALGGTTTGAQQPRGLKRHSNMAQRIAQYVRPATDTGGSAAKDMGSRA
ncbi:uncharacterized protein E0L32_010303 [Thyridium curvatum]|uniref:Uncharacterized protein n=1 Tax=Thyridium curvatum TaxID=1093900 RepID=A0A507AGL6_9PEZI|nr:uncharacterized protein E0L32_010303 [Thyridium curvatum]TPX07972.1 hypothetical protein E0L32_010303 [Thyridium curvatum]